MAVSDYEKAALDFANMIRTELQDRKPLRKLPKGTVGDPNSCPIARAINGDFKATVMIDVASFLNSEGKRRRRRLPQAVQNFIYRFDKKYLPHLVDVKASDIYQLEGKLKLLKSELKSYQHSLEHFEKWKDEMGQRHAKYYRQLVAKTKKSILYNEGKLAKLEGK